MLADKIYKNAKVFTADKDRSIACAFAVKDGTFCYVGDETGLSAFEGETIDLGGRFVMPGIIDSHVHVTFPIGFEYDDMGLFLECKGKREAMDIMAAYVRDNPGVRRYKFKLEKKRLMGEDITRGDLDAICPDAELIIQEEEGHSVWVNSRILERHHITDDTPDPVPGLSYYVRDEDGHVTGNIFEGSAEMPIILDSALELTDDEIDAALQRWIDFCVNAGVTCVFDAGIPGFNEFHERAYGRLRELDKQGKLPIYIDGCYVVTSERDAEEGLANLRRLRRECDTDHLRVHTMKIFMDGTQAIHTAAMVEPYADTGASGSTAFTAEGLARLLLRLDEEGLDLHLHTVGERASRVVLDAVELARRELAGVLRVRVTCAHLEVQDDADIPRFAELGVFVNYTPWWHGDDITPEITLLGEERARNKQFRCKSVWDTGALVTWSSDEITYDFENWSPYLGMEVGMTRWINERTKASEYKWTDAPLPPLTECMGIEEMLLGYTINGAVQLGIDASKGSITEGKDADFLVFDTDLLTAEHEGLSQIMPAEVYFCGKRAN